jgi:hypothetical protein
MSHVVGNGGIVSKAQDKGVGREEPLEMCDNVFHQRRVICHDGI